MRRGAILPALVLALSSVPSPAAGVPDEVEVPAALEDWRGWALAGREHLECPFFASGEHGAPDRHPCAWPGPLDLEAASGGARFEQVWTVHAPSWIPLPGTIDEWPLEVTVDGAAAPVVARGAVPAVFVAAGEHRVRGAFEWLRRPDALGVPSLVAEVRLRLDGRDVFPLRRSDEALWLGRAESEAGEADALSIEVYRRLADGVPAMLETRVRLGVSGRGREVVLGPVFPAGHQPVGLQTGLGLAPEADGRFRVQLRPGQWWIVLHSRATAPLEAVAAPEPDAPWASREIWSYEAAPHQRVTSATSGGLSVDPTQVDVPAEWSGLPAFALTPGQQIEITERSRGMADDANRLHLVRNLWLDFDGAGMTARDRIVGRMVQGFRLDVAPPLELGRARAGDRPLLVTASATGTGVELRDPDVQLEATSRLHRAAGAIPVTGWSETFESVAATLHLPPGRELVAALGADSSPEAWIDRWSLLDVFLVLITSLLADRLLGRRGALVVAAFLVLAHHESTAPLWGLLIVVALLLLRRALPEGRFARVVRGAVLVGLGLLVLLLLPFVAEQLRLALHPQLERHAVGGWAEAGSMVSSPAAFEQQAVDAAVYEEELAASPAPEPAPKRELPKQAVRRLESYAVSNVFQSGGGEPTWGWSRADLGWSGPVVPDQQLRLIVTPTWLTRLLRVVLVGLLGAILALLIEPLRRVVRPGGPGGAAVVASLVALLLGPAATVRAQPIPDPALLAELAQRLSRAPACVPECGRLERAVVRVGSGRMETELTYHAGAAVAVPVPRSPGVWDLDTVEVGGDAGALLAAAGRSWVALEPGVRRVRLAGALAPSDQVEVTFPFHPGSLEVLADGWEIEGVRDGRLVTDTLVLVRRAAVGAEPVDGEPTAPKLPPYVRVGRFLDLDVDWTVRTTVERLAPPEGSLTVEVPLLPGESVLTPGFETRGGAVLAALAAGSRSVSWESRLAPTERLELVAPDLAERAEVWQAIVSPQWSAAFDGVSAVTSGAPDGFWVHEFHPQPGERLSIEVHRPEPVAGPTLAIDSAQARTRAGRRTMEHELSVDLRSTRGGQHVLRLPPEAEVLEVRVDGATFGIRPEEGRLAVPVRPGEQTLSVRFREASASSWRQATPRVDLGAAASNLAVSIEPGAGRWVLLTAGPIVGPAVLYWNQLAVMLLLALLLARLRRTPLRTRDWVLLGIGFSTFSWLALAVVVVWLLALDARGRFEGSLPWWRFDLVQLALAGLTLVALGCLVAAIPYGLLGHPDMYVEGNASSASWLSWFQDRSDGALPEAAVITAPLWVYRVAMLAWALWLSLAVVGWLRWGWGCLTTGGGWRKRPEAAPAAGRGSGEGSGADEE